MGQSCPRTTAPPAREARAALSVWVVRSGSVAARTARAGAGQAPVAADVGPPALEPRAAAQPAQHLAGGVLGDLHQRVPLVDLDGPDVAPGQVRLVGQRAHDVLRAHAAGPARVDEQAGGAGLRRAGAGGTAAPAGLAGRAAART